MILSAARQFHLFSEPFSRGRRKWKSWKMYQNPDQIEKYPDRNECHNFNQTEQIAIGCQSSSVEIERPCIVWLICRIDFARDEKDKQQSVHNDVCATANMTFASQWESSHRLIHSFQLTHTWQRRIRTPFHAFQFSRTIVPRQNRRRSMYFAIIVFVVPYLTH